MSESMKTAIFSDVHGNLSALTAVLDDIKRQKGILEIVFAGDACMFGPRPRECIEILQQLDIRCLPGNTDHWILHPPPLETTSDDKVRSRNKMLGELASWHSSVIGEEGIVWLESLSRSFKYRISPTLNSDDDLLIVHANPVDLFQLIFPSEERQIELYGKIRQRDEELDPLLGQVRASMIAYGHLHIPGQRTHGEIRLTNISSVSMPGDGDVRAKYAVLSWKKETGWNIEMHYVDFDPAEEITAFLEKKPPGWEKAVDSYERFGCIPQNV
ncbi:MAG: metallophosphoesterase family protein [Candidatus Promineifilaceae bacterium]|jgi:predicted phosphodiesterase